MSYFYAYPARIPYRQAAGDVLGVYEGWTDGDPTLRFLLGAGPDRASWRSVSRSLDHAPDAHEGVVGETLPPPLLVLAEIGPAILL